MARSHRSYCAGVLALVLPAAAPAQQPDAPRREVYFEFQVDKAAEPLPGGATPHFPASMRATRTSGEVIAQFVVDTAGIADVRSFRVLHSTHADYTASVRDVVPRMRFRPAELQGKRVHQLVQMPFVVNIAPDTLGSREMPIRIETTKEPGAEAQAAPGDPVVYDEGEVDTQVAPVRGNRPLRYPEDLRSESIRGQVIVQLVVTDDGTVLPGSIRILRATHGQFVAAVRQVLPDYRFIPATRQGRRVHARVQMPFVFSLGRGAASPTLRRRPGGE